MRRKQKLFLAFLIAGFFFICCSDTVLFKFPEYQLTRCKKKISSRFKKYGIIAIWKFDELQVVESRKRAGCINFGTVLTKGKIGKARAFNGREDNHIETRVAWPSLGNRYTISTWVKLNPSSRYQSIIFTHSAPLHSGIMLQDGNIVLSVPYSTNQFASYPFKKYGEFVHIAGVVDLEKKKACLYENGVLRVSIPIKGVEHIKRYVEFGKYRHYKIYFPLDGVLDETVIWNRPLSPQEILKLSRSKRSISRKKYRVALRYAARLYVINLLSNFVDASTKIIDYFNPVYHESRIFKSDLPVFNFILSRADVRHFNKYKNECLDKGNTVKGASRRRRVELVFNNKVYKARMALYGKTPEYWTNPKKSFSVEVELPGSVLAMKKMVFVPPETKSLLCPLLYREIALKYKLPYKTNGLGVVRINGQFKGIYYFQEHLIDGYEHYDEKEYICQVIGTLPLPAEDVLKTYDSLRKRFGPLLVRDKGALWSSRKIGYNIKKDRNSFKKLTKKYGKRNERDAAEMVRDYLNENLLLNGSPSSSYVIGDLNLDIVDIPGINLKWVSSHPEVIDSRGKITRPKDKVPVNVTLQAYISSGNAVAEKSLHFTVIPEAIKLPVLRLVIPGRTRDCNRTPCLFELIEYGGAGRTGLLSGDIKLRGNTSLHYPKKCYSLKMKTRHRLFDFSDSKIVHLKSAYVDCSFMKNKLAYDIFRSLSSENAPRYSPRLHLVELFINDEYRGIYELSEKVDRFMLGFNKFNRKDSAHSVLYKAGHHRATFQRWTRAYSQIEPDPVYECEKYWKPLKDLINFTGNPSDEMFKENIDKWMDTNNIIDYYILVNLTQNKDGNRANMYLAKDKAAGSRFFIVPWDYDKTMGGRHNRWFTNFLLERLMEVVPGFKDSFKSRWRQLREKQLSEERIIQMIDEIEVDILEGIPREFEQWPKKGITHKETVKELKAWVYKRFLFLDEFIERL